MAGDGCLTEMQEALALVKAGEWGFEECEERFMQVFNKARHPHILSFKHSFHPFPPLESAWIVSAIALTRGERNLKPLPLLGPSLLPSCALCTIGALKQPMHFFPAGNRAWGGGAGRGASRTPRC